MDRMNPFGGRLKEYAAGRVLDFGTGAGRSVRAVMEAVERFETIVGLDTPRPERPLAADLRNAADVDYVQAEGPPLPFTVDCFDTVCLSHVLHHLPAARRRPVLAELRRVLKPGGTFLLVAGYRDGQTGARRTQILCHALRAAMDRDEGVHHYATLLRAEVLELVASMGLVCRDMFDVAPGRCNTPSVGLSLH